MSRHELCYEILNAHNLGDDCTRTIDVHANPDELAQLVREGYLVREGLFNGSALRPCATQSNGSSSRNGSSTAERRLASVPGESLYAT